MERLRVLGKKSGQLAAIANSDNPARNTFLRFIMFIPDVDLELPLSFGRINVNIVHLTVGTSGGRGDWT
jgi:hypothetical protein